MESHDLMKLLVPEGKVKQVSAFTGLSQSLLYQERRSSGDALTDTGTRNTIDRLDLFCEWNLDRNPQVVRMVAERYQAMYDHHLKPIGPVEVNDLLKQLGEVSRECGEAVAQLAQRRSISECTKEVSEAQAALEKALAMVKALEQQ